MGTGYIQEIQGPGSVRYIYSTYTTRRGSHIAPPFKAVERESLALAHIPESWRIPSVIVIRKVGKKDYLVTKSFRSISLTSFILKDMEKIIDNKIKSKLLRFTPLHVLLTNTTQLQLNS